MKFINAIFRIGCLSAFIFSANVNADEQIVSMKCALAIDAAFAELDSQASNPITQQALAEIDDKSGQFVCIQPNEKIIYLRLENAGQAAGTNKLLLTVDANTFEILKTYYGAL